MNCTECDLPLAKNAKYFAVFRSGNGQAVRIGDHQARHLARCLIKNAEEVETPLVSGREESRRMSEGIVNCRSCGAQIVRNILNDPFLP